MSMEVVQCQCGEVFVGDRAEGAHRAADRNARVPEMQAENGGGEVTKANTRVAGHSLLWEGAPHNMFGVRVGYMGVSGWGYGKCSCGEMSEAPLHSGGQRREWHRDHKHEITANKESK